jgi:hypothetical protein
MAEASLSSKRTDPDVEPVLRLEFTEAESTITESLF